jgi:hypothetical protein
MSARSFIRGPRFALRSTEKVRACIRCVYGNGDHAEWCPQKPPSFSLPPITPETVDQDASLFGVDPAASPEVASPPGEKEVPRCM